MPLAKFPPKSPPPMSPAKNPPRTPRKSPLKPTGKVSPLQQMHRLVTHFQRKDSTNAKISRSQSLSPSSKWLFPFRARKERDSDTPLPLPKWYPSFSENYSKLNTFLSLLHDSSLTIEPLTSAQIEANLRALTNDDIISIYKTFRVPYSSHLIQSKVNFSKLIVILQSMGLSAQ